jgi:para-aminobenzoate synthetase component 1
MQRGAPFFWMSGILATDLVDITDDASRLSDGGFWVVAITFEGKRTFAKFATVERNVAFPAQGEWREIRSIWKSSLSREKYYGYVEEIRRRISLGDVYQANACRILSTPGRGESLETLFAAILEKNVAPYASFLRLPEIEIASATPELFLRREGDLVTTSPIKGTSDYSTHDLFGAKDQSENIMIVDLMRNDL